MAVGCGGNAEDDGGDRWMAAWEEEGRQECLSERDEIRSLRTRMNDQSLVTNQDGEEIT